jgi:hypothetical protein
MSDAAPSQAQRLALSVVALQLDSTAETSNKFSLALYKALEAVLSVAAQWQALWVSLELA